MITWKNSSKNSLLDEWGFAMMYWMISANENKYNHVRAFNKWGYIDWKTYANYTVGDIVYIYCSRTKRKVMFKTIVEKTGIPFNEKTDDENLWNEKDEVDRSMKYTRLRLIRTVDRDELSLENIRKIGIKNGPERPMKLSEDTVNYFEKFFSIGVDEEGIISFPCGKTYDLVRETNIHAHPVDDKPNIDKVPRYLMVRATGGFSDDLFEIERTIEFNPFDKDELVKYKSEWFYNNLKLYISKRANSKFGFESAPSPYRYYILKKVYFFKPAYAVEINNPNYRFLTFEDIGVKLASLKFRDIHELYEKYYKQEKSYIPQALANAARAHKSFINSFPRNAIADLSLDDYLIAKEGYGNPESFCRRIRFEMDAMGHMGDVRFNVFGVYIRGGDELTMSDTLKNMFGNDINRAFEFQKNEMVRLLDSFEKKNFDEIKNIKLNSIFKYRLLMVYYPNDIIPVCAKETLNGYCDSVGISYDTDEELVYRNMALVEYKNSIEELARLTNFEAMRFYDWLWRCNIRVKPEQQYKNTKSNEEQKKSIIKVTVDEIDASEEEENSIQKALDLLLSNESEEVTGFEYIAKPEERREVKASSDSTRPPVYPRDPQKRINALNRVGFVCEINPDHISFISKKTDMPYMETHHLIPLEYWQSFDNNLDVEANIVCLCSNCHNEIHYGKYADKLIKPLFKKREHELQEAGISIDLDDLLKLYNGEEIE